HAGDVLHRALADALAHAAPRLGVELSVEGGRGPVDQAQSVDASMQAPADAAEVEHAGDVEQVEVVQRQVGRQRGRDAERALHRQRTHVDAAIEQVHAQAAVEVQ